MRSKFAFVMIAVACVFAASIALSGAGSASGPPPWAYGFETPAGTPAPVAAPAAAPAAPDTSMKHLPGSDKTFTRQQIADQYGPADWFPGDHPPMPPIVANGRRDAMIAACSLCHYPNGKGRQENAGVSGLPVSYFIQTMHDFRDGLRKSADPRKANTNRMIGFAKNMTEDEIKAAADYFGAMKWTPWITKVVETKMVPKIHNANGLFLTLEGNEKEPIGHRLLETPVDAEAAEILRNPRSGFIVYAPPGSLKKGEALVKTGAGRTTACALCHGEGLRGLGPVPGIAGRSPSYLGRQLYDMQNGFRKGEWTSLMKPVVEKLTEDDIIAITAYTASLQP
jgi:cytochrome c553